MRAHVLFIAAASDKVYQLLAHSRWFSPGAPASPTTKTGCHDIAEILLKVALITKIQSNQSCLIYVICGCLRIVVSNTYCVVFLFVCLRLVYPILPVSLECPFLIATSAFSNVYFIAI